MSPADSAGLRETLSRILTEYTAATKGPFSKSTLADFVRHAAADSVARSLGEFRKGMKVAGSAGAGNWAEVPWLAIFDPLVTTTARAGYYVVFLFSPTSTPPLVFLSL